MLGRQLFRFGMIGGLSTVAHLAVGLALHHFAGFSPLWANLFAFLSAWSVSYAGNWLWTFEARTAHAYSVPRYVAVALSCFALNQSIVFMATEFLGWPFWLALIPVVLIVPAVGFVASRYWAYRASHGPA